MQNVFRIAAWVLVSLGVAGCEPKMRGASSDVATGGAAGLPRVPPAPASGGTPSAGAPTVNPSGEWTAGIVRRAGQPRGTAVLRALRFARHDEFDRVVFEFAGNGVPASRLEYIDKPVRKCGSGEPTPIAGDAWLSVTLEPAAAHTEAGVPTLEAREVQPELPILREIELTCDFEAQVAVVFGVSRPNRFRVLELSDPSRLVVDLRH